MIVTGDQAVLVPPKLLSSSKRAARAEQEGTKDTRVVKVIVKQPLTGEPEDRRKCSVVFERSRASPTLGLGSLTKIWAGLGSA